MSTAIIFHWFLSIRLCVSVFVVLGLWFNDTSSTDNSSLRHLIVLTIGQVISLVKFGTCDLQFFI